MHANADPEIGVAELRDLLDELERGVKTKARMIVLGDGGSEDREESVSQLAADNAPVASDRLAHRGQGRFQPVDGPLGTEIDDQARGGHEIGAQDRYVFELARKLAITSHRQALLERRARGRPACATRSWRGLGSFVHARR